MYGGPYTVSKGTARAVTLGGKSSTALARATANLPGDSAVANADALAEAGGVAESVQIAGAN